MHFKIFQHADVNKDEVISLDEWLAHCETVPEIRALFLFAVGNYTLCVAEVVDLSRSKTKGRCESQC